jgi:hypothetical protein
MCLKEHMERHKQSILLQMNRLSIENYTDYIVHSRDSNLTYNRYMQLNCTNYK